MMSRLTFLIGWMVALASLTYPMYAQQSQQVQSGGADISTEATLLLVRSDTSAMATSLDNIENALSVDAVHGNAVVATGPGIQCEAGDIDGSAQPNAVTEGQSARVKCTLGGGVQVTLANEAGTVDIGASITTAVQLIDDIVGVEDVAETAGAGLARMGAVVRLAAAGSTATDNENATVNVDGLGLLWARQLDPCSGVAKSYYVVDTADGTNLELANAVSSQYWYICSVNLVAAGATVVLISIDDTDGCGSPSAGLHGGSTGTTTEGWSFAANGGIALGNGGSTVMKAPTADRYLCIDQSASVQLSGTISYVSAP